MFLITTPQKLTAGSSKSAEKLVKYLEKENKGKNPDQKEYFFNQNEEKIEPDTVTREIDANTSYLKKTVPRYYSVIISPSKRELQHIGNDPALLRLYTREVMKKYAEGFRREIDGKPVSVDDIRYFAKIEYQRGFKGFDRKIKENAPFLKKLSTLEKQIRNCSGQPEKAIKFRKELKDLREQTPHKMNGVPIKRGMPKAGLQTHIHIIVSRKDASNRYSLSPGSKYRSSDIIMHGKLVKRGFDRDRFYARAEKTFDMVFGYKRNYVESYEARKTLIKNPQKYYAHLKDLSVQERRIAFTVLGHGRVGFSYLNISPNQVTFALKQVRKALETGVRSSSISY